ncbi:cellulose biosynthesis protein BcsO [uncultured Klebsiella sp.]|uniref:cellulose biosynthesis protein BcsO n=1 Tax=uncultured Klebsiella sp. TaxID=284011 RepID=UPI0028062489|nr:cellulose biosynthesis protein BcsO [uncultured Klebsiella sp.]
MNHYDDLQRFKEKTRTQRLQFKDLSSETAVGEKGDWAILNQLMPVTEEPTLAMAETVSLPSPQLVSVDTFTRVESHPVQAVPSPSLVAPVATAPEPVAASAQPVSVTETSEPAAVETVVQENVTAPEPVTRAVMSQPTPPREPAPAIRSRPAITSTTGGFAHLFATQTVTAGPVAKGKDQPLKSLLERIATCR